MSPFAGEFERYRRLLIGAIEQVDNAAFFDDEGGARNSIAVIVKHLAGNLKSRFTNFLTEDGEKPWRQRDEEFVVRSETRDELLADLAASFEIVGATLAELDEQDRGRTVRVRGVELTVDEALARAVGHAAYHVGGAVTLARRAKGSAWTSLSIPPGDTTAYNRNPTRERPPQV